MAQDHAVQQGELESQRAGPQTCEPLLAHSASLQVTVKTRLEPQSAILVSDRQLRAEVFCKCFFVFVWSPHGGYEFFKGRVSIINFSCIFPQYRLQF